jgi:acetolactate synthase-1/2/3 large subunit
MRARRVLGPLLRERGCCPRRRHLSATTAVDRQGLSGGYLLHQSLVDAGVRHIFGYSGGANLPILDAFHDSPIQFVMNRSEQCCGHAAEGYAKATGECGVVLTTSGPGLTNIITPLQDAKGDSVPMVALSGQVPTGAMGTDAFQVCIRPPGSCVQVQH